MHGMNYVIGVNGSLKLNDNDIYRTNQEEAAMDEEYSTISDKGLKEFCRVSKLVTDLEILKKRIPIVKERLENLRFSRQWNNIEDVNNYIDETIKELEGK